MSNKEKPRPPSSGYIDESDDLLIDVERDREAIKLKERKKNVSEMRERYGKKQ